MILLAIDTAANLCAACIHDTETGELGREVLDIGKGHAEQLIGVIDAALEKAGCAYGDLEAIAVSVGPGSFTGVRIGVATARGLALALKLPAVGVTTLEALAIAARDAFPGRQMMAVNDAGRAQFHVARFGADGLSTFGPAAVSLGEAVALAGEGDPVLAGSAAASVSQASGRALDIAGETATADISAYARAAGRALSEASAAGPKPKPLYLRDADAKPQVDFALARKPTP